MAATFKNFIRNFKREVGGNVTVELALIMSIFILVILYGVDFSRMAIEKHRLEQFARAGAQFGFVSEENAMDSSGVTAAVSTAAGADADSLTISSISHCECPSDPAAACDETCPDDSTPDLYLVVTVSKNYSYLFTLGAQLGGDVLLEGSTTVRVR